MGLDIGTPSDPHSGSGNELLEAAESAIATALRLNCNRLSFNTAASYVGREHELAEACAQLRRKFPALQEIAPTRLVSGATVYLNKKPGALVKFLASISQADM